MCGRFFHCLVAQALLWGRKPESSYACPLGQTSEGMGWKLAQLPSSLHGQQGQEKGPATSSLMHISLLRMELGCGGEMTPSLPLPAPVIPTELLAGEKRAVSGLAMMSIAAHTCQRGWEYSRGTPEIQPLFMLTRTLCNASA